MNEDGKFYLITFGIYYGIGIVLAFLCRIWYLKTYDEYHINRMNPFAWWLGEEQIMTFCAWPVWTIIAAIAYIVDYLPNKITGNI